MNVDQSTLSEDGRDSIGFQDNLPAGTRGRQGPTWEVYGGKRDEEDCAFSLGFRERLTVVFDIV